METTSLSLIGMGSQGSAWALNARDSGWGVRVYLHHEGPSWAKALSLGFKPTLLSEEVPSGLIALLCPDSAIIPLVRKYFSGIQAHFVLAHGFAYVAGLDRELGSNQVLSLLAPKAIGPELRNAFVAGKGIHTLSAAFFDGEGGKGGNLLALAHAIGFKKDGLIPTGFQEEAKADWMSEQGVLCGGLFTLLLWTLEEMERAGVSKALQREECLTELKLIANVLREKGLEGGFKLISDAAKAGTIQINRFLEEGGLKERFQARLREGSSTGFPKIVDSGEWRNEAESLMIRLRKVDPIAQGKA